MTDEEREAAKAARREYKKKWAKEHPESVRATQAKYWAKYAARKKAEKEAQKGMAGNDPAQE